MLVLPDPVWPTMAIGLAGLRFKTHIVEDGRVRSVVERDVIESDRAFHLARVARAVFVQIALRVDQRQDAARARQAGRDLRIGKRRRERGKTKHQQLAVEGHHLADVDQPLPEQNQRMRQPDCVGEAQQEQGDEARLDEALPHVGVAIRARARLEFVDGLLFLRRAL